MRWIFSGRLSDEPHLLLKTIAERFCRSSSDAMLDLPHWRTVSTNIRARTSAPPFMLGADVDGDVTIARGEITCEHCRSDQPARIANIRSWLTHSTLFLT